MKKLIPLLILVGGAVSGFSQGSVTFRNAVAFQTTDSTGGERRVYDAGSPIDPVNGVALTGTQYVAELYYGTSAGSLSPLTTSISRFRGSTTAASNKGKWGNTTITGALNDPTLLPGTQIGDVLFMQVKVWNFDANGGIGNVNNTYELAASGNKGTSIVFTYKVPQPTDPPAALFMENLQAFALVPEPSAIALGVLGVAGLLLIRRRK